MSLLKFRKKGFVVAAVRRAQSGTPMPARAGETEAPKPSADEIKAEEKRIQGALDVYVPDEQLSPADEKTLNAKEVTQVIEIVAKNKGIGFDTAVRAVASLIRKGASNAKASDTLEAEVLCPTNGVRAVVLRYDVGMALYAVKKHKTIRKLAEALAPQMIESGKELLKKNPQLDLKGDLATRINRKLIAEGGKPLTRLEAICCATYTQWLPNLNELAESDRLASLLEKDLAQRKVGQKKSQKKAQKQKGSNKNQKAASGPSQKQK